MVRVITAGQLHLRRPLDIYTVTRLDFIRMVEHLHKLGCRQLLLHRRRDTKGRHRDNNIMFIYMQRWK